MKTQKEIEAQIKEIENVYEHVLTGSLATIQINAPRALSQIEVETELKTLHDFCGLGTVAFKRQRKARPSLKNLVALYSQLVYNFSYGEICKKCRGCFQPEAAHSLVPEIPEAGTC